MLCISSNKTWIQIKVTNDYNPGQVEDHSAFLSIFEVQAQTLEKNLMCLK